MTEFDDDFINEIRTTLGNAIRACSFLSYRDHRTGERFPDQDIKKIDIKDGLIEVEMVGGGHVRQSSEWVATFRKTEDQAISTLIELNRRVLKQMDE